MRVLEPCRSQPQRRGATFLCGIACLFVYACDNGKGSPIIAVDSGTGDALGGSIAGRSGRIDASVIDDDDEVKVTQTSECKSLESMWSNAYAFDENKLFDRINQLRANPLSLCSSQFPALPPLVWDPALQCSARLRLAGGEGGPRGPSSGPSYYSTFDSFDPRGPDQGPLHDREKLANARVDAEVIFSNVSKVDAVLDVLEEKPEWAGNFCIIAVTPILSVVGIARYGNVWVLDFGSTASGTPRSPSTGMGNAGSGNSGTGGR
jgi:hypothetical protein